MTKINQSIKIVSSSQAQLSSISQPSRQAIYDILTRHYTDVEIVLVDTVSDLRQLASSRPDLVFLGMKFIPSNPSLGINDPHKIWLSDYLESRGISCTGSTSQAHELELNKPLAKQAVVSSGLNTAPFFTVNWRTQQLPADTELGFPLFVKPTNRGGGLGIDDSSVVHNRQQLVSKVQQIANQHHSDSLVEQLLPGREFSVAILRQPQTMQYRALPIELVVEANQSGYAMLSSAVKSSNNERVSTVSDSRLAERISRLAIDAFKSIGGRDYGRIDIRLDQHGNPAFLEANLIPSLIRDYGSFAKACKLHLSLDHEDMIMKIVNLASARSQTSRYIDTARAEAGLSGLSLST